MSMTNPSTAAAKSAACASLKPAGALKRDINLLPANENSEKIARGGTVVLAAVVGLLLLGYFAVWMPQQGLNALQAQAEAKAGEAASLAGTDAEFNGLIARRNTLNAMLQSLDAFGGEPKPADTMKAIADACPGGITLISVTLSADGAVIDGRAASDGDIAQFIVNLRTLPQYASVELNSVAEDTADESISRKRLFELKAAAPAAAQTDAKGGDGQ